MPNGARRAARSMLTGIARTAWSGLDRLPLGRRAERFLLERTWAAGSAEMLDAYLVAGYQNPRINLQSILVRHFLVSKLIGSELDGLMDDEIRFAIGLNEAIRLRAAELGVRMGSYLNPAKYEAVRHVDEVIADRQMEFQDRWRATLGDRRLAPLQVLELACGSANDYRAFVEAGLAVHLDYRGVDLAAKNIANARRRFPDASFEVADVVDLPYPDGSFDYVVASDLFEHLSPKAMAQALDQAARLARRGLALTFFNMSDVADHEVQRRRAYHWNLLSRSRVEDRLRRDFGVLTVIPIARWLKDRFGYGHSYNPRAWSIFAERVADPGAQLSE